MAALRGTPGEAEAKGTNFVGALRSLRALRGEGAHDATIAALGGAVGEAARHAQIVPVGWYPVSWYVELHATVQSVTGGGLAITRQIAAHTTQHDFTSLHRMLVKMLSPRTVARHTHRLLQLYWRGGEAQVLESRDDRLVVRFSRWRGFGPNVWEDLAGSIEAVLGVVGAPAPQARIVSMSRDCSDADIEARFG